MCVRRLHSEVYGIPVSAFLPSHYLHGPGYESVGIRNASETTPSVGARLLRSQSQLLGSLSIDDRASPTPFT